MEPLSGVKLKLAKKSTFEEGVRDLKSFISTSCSQESLPFIDGALARCFTLLKTRYTSPAFWRSGQDLFLSAQSTIRDSKTLKTKLDSYLEECAGVLGEVSDQAEEQQTARGLSRASYLFEGQLSQAEEPRAQQDSVFDIILGMMARAGASTASEDLSQPVVLEPTEEESARLAALLESDTGGLEDVLQASILDQGGAPPGPPPAAKSAIKALVKETLTDDRLKELGGPDVQCSVCREDLAVGDEVQVMPCSSGHVFHPLCLAPWLAQHNSCPVCRFELETDDQQYERKKEREKTEAEDRKGAENAQSHNDFMYI